MKFNINNYVRVKLTEKGKQKLKKDYESFRKVNPYLREYAPPVEDAEGYSKWQLWCLMEKLGKHISLGGVVPFDTEIDIVFPQQQSPVGTTEGVNQ